MLYNNNRRPVLRAEYPTYSLPGISKVIGDEWKKLNEDQKNVWTEKARSLRLEYEIEKFNAQKQYADVANMNSSGGQQKMQSAKKPAAAPKVGDKRLQSETNNPPGDAQNKQQIQNKAPAGDSSSITSLSDDAGGNNGNVQRAMSQPHMEDDAGDESSDLWVQNE